MDLVPTVNNLRLICRAPVWSTSRVNRCGNRKRKLRVKPGTHGHLTAKQKRKTPTSLSLSEIYAFRRVTMVNFFFLLLLNVIIIIHDYLFFLSFNRIVKKSRPALCPRSEYYCADNFYFDGQLCVGKKKTFIHRIKTDIYSVKFHDLLLLKLWRVFEFHNLLLL